MNYKDFPMKEIMINYDNSFQENNITRVILQFGTKI